MSPQKYDNYKIIIILDKRAAKAGERATRVCCRHRNQDGLTEPESFNGCCQKDLRIPPSCDGAH